MCINQHKKQHLLSSRGFNDYQLYNRILHSSSHNKRRFEWNPAVIEALPYIVISSSEIECILFTMNDYTINKHAFCMHHLMENFNTRSIV